MKGRLFLILMSATALLAACVAVPGMPETGVTPKPTVGPGPTATPPGERRTDEPPPAMTVIVGTSLPPSTVVLSDIQTPTPEPPPQTGADVTVNEAWFRQSVSLTTGQTLAIVLNDEAWQAPTYDAGTLNLLPWPGAAPAGKQAWLFEAVDDGTTLVSMQTLNPPCPPPGGGPCSMRPIKLFEITVVVTP